MWWSHVDFVVILLKYASATKREALSGQGPRLIFAFYFLLNAIMLDTRRVRIQLGKQKPLWVLTEEKLMQGFGGTADPRGWVAIGHSEAARILTSRHCPQAGGTGRGGSAEPRGQVHPVEAGTTVGWSGESWCHGETDTAIAWELPKARENWRTSLASPPLLFFSHLLSVSVLAYTQLEARWCRNLDFSPWYTTWGMQGTVPGSSLSVLNKYMLNEWVWPNCVQKKCCWLIQNSSGTSLERSRSTTTETHVLQSTEIPW